MPQQPLQGLQQMQTKLVNAPAQSIAPIVPTTQQTTSRLVGQLTQQQPLPLQQQQQSQQTPQQISLQQQQSQTQQEPTAAEINLMLNSLGLGLPPNETLQLANWDLKKLAMYLVSNRVLLHSNSIRWHIICRHAIHFSLFTLTLFLSSKNLNNNNHINQ